MPIPPLFRHGKKTNFSKEELAKAARKKKSSKKKGEERKGSESKENTEETVDTTGSPSRSETSADK